MHDSVKISKALEKKSLRKYTKETFISYDRQNNAQLCQNKQNMQPQKTK